MDSFETFLIAEFNEQHNNSRHTESVALQAAQFFFTLEGALIAGVAALLPTAIIQSTTFLPPVFAFLFLFGHFVTRIAVNALIATSQVEFQATLIRLYFADSPAKRSVLYFWLDPDKVEKRQSGSWEKWQNTMPVTPRFVAYVNSANLVLTLGSFIYVIATVVSPSVNNWIADNLLVLIWGLIPTVCLIACLYVQLVYTRIARRAEKATIEDQKAAVNRMAATKLIKRRITQPLPQ